MDRPLTAKDRSIGKTTREIAAKIAPLLVDHPRKIQGVVLGQLMATWLSDHYEAEDPTRQAEIWNTVLSWQTEYIFRQAELDRRRKRALMRAHHESRRLPVTRRRVIR